MEHNAGYVEYTIENWLKKRKDHLPAASVELLESFEFELIGQIKVKRLKFSPFLLSISVQIVSGFAEICEFRGIKDHQEVALKTVLRLIMMQQFIMLQHTQFSPFWHSFHFSVYFIWLCWVLSLPVW